VSHGALTGASGVPIIRLGDTLIVSVQEALHDRLALALQDDITAALGRSGAAGLLIDVSVIDVVDSFMGRMINDIAAMAQLMGARTALVGIQPAVAITLTELGLELRGVVTALNVEQGLARLREAGTPGTVGRAAGRARHRGLNHG
jgi:rsbT antagonist protein RsbS